MTEEQKRELEKQANYYSHDFFERLKNGLDTEIPNTRFLALERAVGVFGYEFVEDGHYEPVVRGITELDLIKPREEWQWGDIFRNYKLLVPYFDDKEGIVMGKVDSEYADSLLEVSL